MTDLENKKTALKVSVITIIINLFLTAGKLIAGLLGNSSAMVSDAVHSASDVITTVIVIIGVIIAGKPVDKFHPYGHERLECVASVILSMLLFATGVILGVNGAKSLITGAYKEFALPSLYALITAAVSVLIKEGMFRYTIINAKKINSLSLKADAWHHRADALSSLGSLLGVGAAIIWDMPIFDVIASLVICLMILRVAVSVFIDTVNKMVDKSCPEEKVKEIKTLLENIEGVLSVDDVKTRMFGNRIYVDAEIGAYKNLTLEAAHKIAETAHLAIENYDPDIKHCMVHVNPKDLPLKSEEEETV